MSSEVLDQCRDFFVRYPSSKGETYGQHLIKNLSLACQKSLESTVLLIHGIFPNFFQSEVSKIMGQIDEREDQHGYKKNT